MKRCLCAEFEDEAKRFSANGRVYIAQGVRCDGKKKVQDVIDHLLGPSHNEVAIRTAPVSQHSFAIRTAFVLHMRNKAMFNLFVRQCF